MPKFKSVPPPQRQRNPIRVGHLIIIIAVITFGWSLVQYLLLSDNYNKGIQAYEATDCQTALGYFDRVLDEPQLSEFNDYAASVKAKKAECEAFLTALQQQKSGKVADALVAYSDLINHYPNGALVTPIRQHIATLFEQAQQVALAQPKVCSGIDTLVKNNLISHPDTYLPSFYRNCGQMYVAGKDYTNATVMYENFLDKFPQHQLAPEVKAAWAQSVVAEAKAKGASDIQPPEPTGISSPGSTVVEIRNDSPTKMRLIFSGPEPRFEEIESCSDCVKYQGSGPKTCPEKGPVGHYTLKPGEYDVVVKSISVSGVRPFTGKWVLRDSTVYSSCFFIVQQPSPN